MPCTRALTKTSTEHVMYTIHAIRYVVCTYMFNRCCISRALFQELKYKPVLFGRVAWSELLSCLN